MTLVFWDVDTQNDFMNADGALYVPDAEGIKPNIARIQKYVRSKRKSDISAAQGIREVKSRDVHVGFEPELQKNGGPFPDHCMINTVGQENIKETAPLKPMYVEHYEYNAQGINRVIDHRGEIIIQKQHYDVFTNPNTRNIVTGLNIHAAVLYGVATDYCVKAAALGLREMGIDVYLVTDAISAVTAEGGLEALTEMHRQGIKDITTDNVLDGQLEEYIHK
jgi:nicotinamidase/pyrazinamidase